MEKETKTTITEETNRSGSDGLEHQESTQTEVRTERNVPAEETPKKTVTTTTTTTVEND